MKKLSYDNQERAANALEAYLSNRATLDGSESLFGSEDPEGGAVRAARAIRAAFVEIEREEEEHPEPAPGVASLAVRSTTSRKARAEAERVIPFTSLPQADEQKAEPWISASEWGLCYWPTSAVSDRMFPYRFIGVHAVGRDAWSVAIVDCEDLRKRGDDRPRMRVQFWHVVTKEDLADSSRRADLEKLAERSWINVRSSREEVRQSVMSFLEVLAAQGDVDAIGADPWVLSAELKQMRHRGWPTRECTGSSASMSEAAQIVADAVRWGTLVHHGHPVIQRMLVETVAHKTLSGHVLPAELDTGSRIDGPLALVKAVQVALQHFQNVGKEES